ncbi:hypothetical protein CFSAN001091_03504, partial [Salmonella enterica subsp. enterica serovar Nchanga str. CFSAN001091]
MACKRLLEYRFAIETTEGLMLSNDILRSVRYILKANNTDLARILALGNVDATPEQIAI